MSQINLRKEPTFGEPSDKISDKVENNETPTTANPTAKETISVSLHSSKAPGYTFTPVMKRPLESASQFSTLEEKAMIEKNESPTSNVTKPTQATGFAFAPVNEKTEAASTEEPKAAQDTPKTESAETTAKAQVTTDTTIQSASKTNEVERVIPVQPPADAKAKPTIPTLDKVPSKYRRLLLVGGLGVVLLLVFFLLKPSTPETVEELQQQGTSLPIEFRPVDEAEAKRAEEEAKALQEKARQEAEALAQQQAQQAQQAQQSEALPQTQTQQPAATTPEQPTLTTATTPVEQSATEIVAVAVKPIEPTKPTTGGSVIHQPEQNVVIKVERPKTVEKTVEKPKPAVQQPKTDAKAQTTAAKPKTESTKPTAPAAVSSKTMTVPKGVSLMQVFRNHGLNIADVNAMSKTNNVVSRLKEGEKVTVRLDKNNRVTELTIGSGGKFVRQADGSYTFK
ncbi:LysM-like peptidoglycan-binding domain-containing protein [Glaesserella sp.]|uniref:LysM-like peptidoglycan-binding domain-containing protein n=2 Tax=Glaesserella sp. TaxID=2094731 RepID=UPI00359F3E15